jgi:3-hydroxyisobutyrate dehydrogenase-like beta-hydroxyacid dehydrogenase
MTIRNIGLVGAGLMGHGIGRNILTRGYPLSVCVNRNRAPVESLLEMGATERATPAEVAAHSDLVILCVTGSPEVEAVLMGEHGVMKGANPGLMVADCSTAEPASTIRLAALLAKSGVTLVDTPLTRTPKEAEAGPPGA